MGERERGEEEDNEEETAETTTERDKEEEVLEVSTMAIRCATLKPSQVQLFFILFFYNFFRALI